MIHSVVRSGVLIIIYLASGYQFARLHEPHSNLNSSVKARARGGDVGVLPRHWPGWASWARVRKERAFFNVAETNGSRYRSTHVPDGRGTGRPVAQARKARLAGHRRAFCGSFSLEVMPSIAAALARCPLPELPYVAFGVNVHLLPLRPSLSATANSRHVWNSSAWVSAIRINGIVMSICFSCTYRRRRSINYRCSDYRMHWIDVRVDFVSLNNSNVRFDPSCSYIIKCDYWAIIYIYIYIYISLSLSFSLVVSIYLCFIKLRD